MCGIRGKNSTSALNKNTALQINNDHATTSYSDDECAIIIQSFTTNTFRNSFDQKVKR